MLRSNISSAVAFTSSPLKLLETSNPPVEGVPPSNNYSEVMPAVKNLPPWASAAKLDAAKVLAAALVTALETGSNSGSGPDQAINLRAEVRRFEENLIRSALKQTGGRQRRAARLLSMNVSSLNSRIKRYRLNASDEGLEDS